jgi:hypothetical protein
MYSSVVLHRMKQCVLRDFLRSREELELGALVVLNNP